MRTKLLRLSTAIGAGTTGIYELVANPLWINILPHGYTGLLATVTALILCLKEISASIDKNFTDQ